MGDGPGGSDQLRHRDGKSSAPRIIIFPHRICAFGQVVQLVLLSGFHRAHSSLIAGVCSASGGYLIVILLRISLVSGGRDDQFPVIAVNMYLAFLTLGHLDHPLSHIDGKALGAGQLLNQIGPLVQVVPLDTVPRPDPLNRKLVPGSPGQAGTVFLYSRIPIPPPPRVWGFLVSRK